MPYKITPEHIETIIKDEKYFQPEGSTLTICVLTLENGFLVTGESAAADPENFSSIIGADLALKKAKEKIWALEGYLLRQKLHEEEMFEKAIQEEKCRGCE